MVDSPFEFAATYLNDIGFYTYFVPFLFFSAVMFALLRKTKALGDSNIINGAVALSVGLLIMGFPVLVGLDYTTAFSTFFTQIAIWIVILVVAVLISGVFYPDINKVLMEQFKHRSFLFIMMAMGITIFVISGMMTVFVNVTNPAQTGQEPEVPQPPTDIVIIIAAVIIMMVLMIIATTVSRGAR